MENTIFVLKLRKYVICLVLKYLLSRVTGESIFIKIVRNTENIAKENVSKKVCDRESQQSKVSKISCVKILMYWYNNRLAFI